MTRRVIQVLFGVAALLALASTAAADCPFSGKVTSPSGPVRDAQVVIERDRSRIAQGTTRADGTYELAYPEFPSNLRAARVIVSASDYSTDARLLFRRGENPCLETARSDVVLEPASGAPTDYSQLGQTILVLPYTLYGDSTDAIAATFNQDLPSIVHHKLLAFNTGLGTSALGIDFTVTKLNETARPAEGERIRRLGYQRKALAVIAGEGDLVADASAGDAIEVVSVFRTIPAYRDMGNVMVPINDRIPAGQASPSRLGRGLSDLWAKQALLSYILQRLATHQVTRLAPNELDRLDVLLVRIQSTMTADDLMLSLVTDLRAAIEAERAP